MMKQIMAVFSGLLCGFVLVVAGLYLWPFSFEDRSEIALDTLDAGTGKTESFFLNITGDTALITHGGGFPFKPIPEGIVYTGGGRTPGTLALVTKFRPQADSEVFAFGTELEISHEDSSLLFGSIMTHTLWSIVVPGRGVLHLYQVENNWRLLKRVLLPMLISGKPFSGEFTGVNTLGPLTGYQGLVVGGTGDFAGASGSFVEIGTLTHATPGGRLTGLMELRVNLSP